MTRARMTQVTNLLGLSPELQEPILTGDAAITERMVRWAVLGGGWGGRDDEV